MDSGIYNDWRLVSLSPFPTWALVLLCAAVAAGLVLASLSVRREPKPARRRALVALRLVGAAALVLLLLEPGQRLMQTTRVKNRVLLLFDRSASMGFPASPGGATRAATAAALLENSSSSLTELSSRFTVETWAFDKDLQALDREKPQEGLAPRGASTDIAGAIRQAASGGGAAAGRKLSGVVVVSDGADNTELAEGLNPRAKAMLQDLKVPVSTVLIGSGGLKDLAVEKVAVDDFAFVRNTVEVTATVRARGFGAQEVPVTLKREGRVVATRNLTLEADGSFPVAFSFAPDQTGQFVYTVEVPVFADEAVATNNARSFTLKVIRDRVRALMVVGRPSWDERFLRGLLKQDPNVDLISFFILRTVADDPKVRGDDELSLIPFPVREIFQEQLKTFDLVILQNFAHDDRSYQMGQYLRGMRDYIQDGGALVMVGGENSFGEGHYDRTDLQEALPVEPTGTKLSTEPFKARLTAEGRRHPVTALGPTADATDRIWAELPEVDGIQVVRPKANARVLVEHPFLTVDGHNAPLVVLGEFGRGRTMAILSDATWNWSFGAAAQGSSVRGYDRFWTNAIRWLVRDPDLTPVKVSAEKPMVEPGEPVAAVVSARRADYGPAAGAQIDLELVQADDGQVVGRQQAVVGPEGTARIELMPPRPGAFKLVGRVHQDATQIGQGEDVVAVRASGPELSDASPHPEILKAIAEATGGAFMDGPRALRDFPLVDPESVEVGRRKDVPVWDGWWSLAVLAACIGAEWGLRRRWGYP